MHADDSLQDEQMTVARELFTHLCEATWDTIAGSLTLAAQSEDQTRSAIEEKARSVEALLGLLSNLSVEAADEHGCERAREVLDRMYRLVFRARGELVALTAVPA